MNEQDIPIDIHSNKLLDWLTSRRHCTKDWHLDILKIRENINNAIQDMPAHEGIVKLLSGSHINYFHCLKIVEILKETEADTKNLFGRYGSQRMKDWQEIIQLYQKDNLYLAEAAQILIRNTNFEVPSLRKQITKLEQLHNEYIKKEKDYMKAENTSRNEFNATCKQLGIPGKQIKNELSNILEELPEIYEKVGQNFKTIKTAIDVFAAFVEFNSVKDKSNNCLSLIKYIVENGNTSCYEWTYGEKPIALELPQSIITDIEEKPKTDGIDFGDSNEIDFGGLDTAANIDFGNIDFGDVKVEKGEIDWGNLNTDENEQAGNQEIDFDISLEESGIIVEEAGIEGGVARGMDALTLLDNPRTRNQVIDELMELQAFLKMRLYEMSGENDLLTISHMQNAPAILQMQTLETVSSMMGTLEIILNELTNNRTMHLHNIKHSPKYIDMLVHQLKQKITVTDKMQQSRKIVLEKAEEARQEALEIQPVIDLIVEKTKILQEQIENEISKKYKNRVVNIIGGIKTL